MVKAAQPPPGFLCRSASRFHPWGLALALGGTAERGTAQGVPVVPPAEHTVDFTSSSRRRDVFVRNVFEIPPTLKYGWYTVKVTVNEPRLGTQSQMGMDLLWTHSLAAGTKHFDRNLTSAVLD